MNHTDKLNAFKKSCITTYPSLSNYDFSKSNNLIADFKIPISPQTIAQINNFVETIYSLSRKPDYTEYLINKYPHYINLLGAHNYSVLMSYDFHIDENGFARLIEVNTNASSYLIGNEVSKSLTSKSYINILKDNFINEFSKSKKEIKNIVIIDENPENQFMYLEFLMFKDLFTSWGYKCSILDYQEIKYVDKQLIDQSGTPIDFIYNRYCDFTLTDESSKHLFDAYTKNECLFSPNPKEYLLLADKNRMVEWSDKSWQGLIGISSEDLTILDNTLIPSSPIKQFNSETLWANKKNYFFKPAHSFGGKSVYRGKSLTKKTFERLLTADTLVQKFVPAPTIKIDNIKWKYDLRAYAYKNKVNYILARSYQGQVTNAQTLGGGLSLISAP